MSEGAQVRAVAAQAIVAVLDGGRSLKAVLAEAMQAVPDVRDRALLEAICFSVLRHRRRYQSALSHWLDKPLPARDAPVQALLLVGLAQIDALGLPAHAAVDSTAEAARRLSRPRLVGLVNAILRRALREGLPAADSLAVQTSHPDWLVEHLRRDWPDDYEHVLQANNQAAPLWLRVDTARASRAAVADGIREHAPSVRAPEYPEESLLIAERLSPTQLPGWQDGTVTVQGGAAQLAVEALAVRSGERVLDACAAPGGKTAQIAARIGDGQLLALDREASRLPKITQTLRRMRLDSPRVQVRCADAAEPATWWDGQGLDAILLDAPCSATGIIRRQPDIKWHRRADDIPALAAQQARLLDALWPLLKPGGRLLYATCSVLKAENEQQIDAFLARTPEAQVQALDRRYGRISGAGRQRLPGEDEMDGFFYALLAREG